MDLDYTGFRPQAADDIEPELSLDRLLCSPLTFFAVMRGHAMTMAGVRHNDLLVIEPDEVYRDGSIVLAFVHREAIVRRLERTATGFVLNPANPRIPSLVVGDDVLIRGRLVAAITLLARPRVKLPLAS
jgi:SOS-response transcriptional repressor LexA